MLSSWIRCGSGVLVTGLFVLLAGVASAAPCCVVTAIDGASGTVTAEETSTGTSFEFRVLKRQLGNLQIGSLLDADLDARVVIFGDRSIAMRKLTRARRQKDDPEAEVEGSAAETTLDFKMERERRDHRDEPNRSARDTGRETRTEEGEDQPSTAENDPPDGEHSDVEEQSSEESEKLDAAASEGGKKIRSASGRRAQKSKEPQENDPSEKKLDAVPSSDSQQLSASAGRGRRNVPPRQSPPPPKPCYVGGCSNQICSGTQGVISTCEYRPQYQCYESAECKLQPSGVCGWTQTQALTACLSEAEE